MNRIVSWVLGTTLCAGSAFSAGFEKTVMWSGRYTGLGGAAASLVSGSEGLLFNPAGLVATDKTMQAAVNLSPSWTQTKAPIFQNNVALSSKRLMRWPLGLTAQYAVMPDLAVGLGVFAAGGAGSDYGQLSFASSSITSVLPEYKSSLAITELGLGAAYRVMPGLRVGLSWRASFVSAEFKYPAVISSTAVAAVTIKDLSAKNFAGFRLGAQYSPEGMPFGFGLSLRSPIKFTAKGTVEGQVGVANSSTAVALTGGAASVASQLPLQMSFGGHYLVQEGSLLALQYDFTNYAAVKNLDFTGTLTGASPFNSLPLPADITLNWSKMHNVRLGFEQMFMDGLVGRVGYVFTSRVTSLSYPQPTLSSPGAGHTFTMGSGYAIDESLRFDGAFEYSMASGKVTAPIPSTTYQGTYSSNAFGFHIGATYQM